MKGDEFNSTKLNNRVKPGNREFGSRPHHEFSSGPSKSYAPKDDVNVNPTKNDSVKKNIGLGTRPTREIRTKAIEAAKTSSGVHAVTVAATVVAVTTISVATGVGVTKHARSGVTFDLFQAQGDTFSYSLRLYGEEESTYYMDLSNRDYESRQELHVGPNEGVFEGLVEGKTYSLKISEEGFMGSTLYDETFTVAAMPIDDEPLWKGLTIDRTIAFADRVFSITLNYEDPADRYTDFELTIAQLESDMEPAVFPLEKKTEAQTIDLNDYDFDIVESTFHYAVTCKLDGEKTILEEKDFTFDVIPDDTPYWYGLSFDPTVSYDDLTMAVSLSYDDPANRYTDFELAINQLESDMDPAIFTLQKKMEEQTIDLAGYDFNFEEATFHYVVSCKYDGKDTVLEENDFAFEYQRAPISEIYGIVFSNGMNYLDGTFTATLSYVDELGIYDSFFLYLKGGDIDVSFPLEHTTEAQELSVFSSPTSPTSSDEHPEIPELFEYRLTYFQGEDEIEYSSGEVHFLDSAAGEVTFIFPKTADFIENSFEVELYFNDPYNRIGDVYIELAPEDNQNYVRRIDLEKADGVQTAHCGTSEDADAGGFFIGTYLSETDYIYNFAYDYDGEYTIQESGTVTFTNSRKSVFNEFRLETPFSQDGDFLPVYLDFDDDAREYENIELTLTGSSSAAGEITYTYPVDVSNGYQMINLGAPNDGPAFTPDNWIDETLHAKATVYHVDWRGGDTIPEVVYEDDILVTSEMTSRVYGIQLYGNELNREDAVIPMRIVMVDDYSYLTEFSVGIKTTTGVTYYFPVQSEFDLHAEAFDLNLANCLNEGFNLEQFFDELSSPADISLRFYTDGEEEEQTFLTDVSFTVN